MQWTSQDPVWKYVDDQGHFHPFKKEDMLRWIAEGYFTGTRQVLSPDQRLCPLADWPLFSIAMAKKIEKDLAEHAYNAERMEQAKQFAAAEKAAAEKVAAAAEKDVKKVYIHKSRVRVTIIDPPHYPPAAKKKLKKSKKPTKGLKKKSTSVICRNKGNCKYGKHCRWSWSHVKK